MPSSGKTTAAQHEVDFGYPPVHVEGYWSGSGTRCKRIKAFIKSAASVIGPTSLPQAALLSFLAGTYATALSLHPRLDLALDPVQQNPSADSQP
jgi:hypothetical protein